MKRRAVFRHKLRQPFLCKHPRKVCSDVSPPFRIGDHLHLAQIAVDELLKPNNALRFKSFHQQPARIHTARRKHRQRAQERELLLAEAELLRESVGGASGTKRKRNAQSNRQNTHPSTRIGL
eukprot:Amastigsp_a339672_20.p2 type:complete len:122 gc:universal Amastigsp_a339672_20:400-35(-)